MPDYAKLIEQEAKRREPWQQLPEFKDWLAGMEPGLDHFFNHLVPDMPDDPYSVAGLRRADSALLRIFPDAEATDEERTPANAAAIDAFRRYIGQTYVRRLEGRWQWLDVSGEGDFLPTVDLPGSVTTVEVSSLLADAAHHRTGDQLAGSFGNHHAEYRAWVEAGRPDRGDWFVRLREIRRARRRAR